MVYIMKIVKSLEESGLLIKTNKRTRGGFLGVLLGTLSPNLLGHMLAGKRAT